MTHDPLSALGCFVCRQDRRLLHLAEGAAVSHDATIYYEGRDDLSFQPTG